VYTSGGGYSTVTVAMWKPICTAPCNRDVSTEGQYRIDAPGAVPSTTFSLANRSPLKLDAKMGSGVQRGGGILLSSLGLTAAILGGTFWALAGARDKPPDP